MIGLQVALLTVMHQHYIQASATEVLLQRGALDYRADGSTLYAPGSLGTAELFEQSVPL